MTNNYCPHNTQARQAQASITYAEHALVDLKIVLSKVTDENLEEAFKNESSDNEICVFLLPGENIAVPLLGVEKNQFTTDFVHLRDLKCSLDNCVKKSKSKLHTLVVKGLPVCRHSLLGSYTIYKKHNNIRPR